jgi:hypothetical protein
MEDAMTQLVTVLDVAVSTQTSDQAGEGLDLWVLFGSIALFLAIVVAITLLRRWR